MVQDASCPDFSGPILPLVDRMDAAVDVVITGHTHQEYICQRPDGKLITQAGSYGRLLTRIDLQVDRVRRKVLHKAASNFVVLNGAPRKDADGQPLPLPQGKQALLPDPAVQSLVQRYTDLTAPLAEQQLGQLSEALNRRTNAAGESSLGAVIADAYLAATSGPEQATKPEDLSASAWNLHPLKGTLKGHWAITVNGNWRVVFAFDGSDAVLLDCRDYH